MSLNKMGLAKQPIVWTIAGSDSGGGAGIQADLHTFHDWGAYGCTVITALTAQHSHAIEQCFVTQATAVQAQIQALDSDLPAVAIKLGMLANADIIAVVDEYLTTYQGYVVCDPVMCSTSGDCLLAFDAIDQLKAILSKVSLITPNRFEAEQLTGITITSVENMAKAAQVLLAMGVRRVLITGGHLPASQGSQLDYWTDGRQPYWLAGQAIKTHHTHGSGCTLSAAIAATLARGYSWLDCLVLAKAYTTAGIRHARQLGGGPGAVVHRGWPDQLIDLPAVNARIDAKEYAFAHCDGELGLYPIVDHVDWLKKLLPLGISTIQLRLKKVSKETLQQQIECAVHLARQYQARLFINDHWQLAIAYGAYGVHLGQEDLNTANLEAISNAKLRLGVSAHSYSEIARAHAVKPSYIALGPVYDTTTKVIHCSTLGVKQLGEWVKLLSKRYTLTAIGGISVERAGDVLATGVGSCAVVSAITQASDYKKAVRALLQLHQNTCQ